MKCIISLLSVKAGCFVSDLQRVMKTCCFFVFVLFCFWIIVQITEVTVPNLQKDFPQKLKVTPINPKDIPSELKRVQNLPKFLYWRSYKQCFLLDK